MVRIILFLTVSSVLIIYTKSQTTSTESHQNVIEKIIKNEIKVEKVCADDLKKFYDENLAIHEVWSNFYPDHKYGNSHDFGNFAGCKSFQLPTQYCMTQYFNHQNPPIPVPPASSLYQSQWTDLDVSFLGAICLPTSCTADDVREVFNDILVGHNLTVGQKISCKTGFGDVSSWNWGRFIIYSIIAITAVISTKFGIQKLKTTEIMKDLMNIKPRNPSTSYLNGIKAIISIIDILTHAWFFRIYFPFKSGENFLKFQTDLYLIFYFVMNIFMEIFFIIGGVLTAKSLAKDYENSNKVKWIAKFYIKRFMRLLPVVLLTIFLDITSNDEFLAPYSFTEDKELYIGILQRAVAFDFREYEKLFKVYKWFILVYAKLTIAAPFIFMPVKSSKYGAISILSITAFYKYLHEVEVASVIIEGGQHIRNIFFALESFDYYAVIQNRCLSFVGGLLLEQYITEKYKNLTNIKSVGLAMIISLIMKTISFFIWKQPELVAVSEIILFSFVILAFYALHFHCGNFKKFLSHKFWTPISKMSLSFYLMSSYVQLGIHRYQLEPIGVENFILVAIGDFLKVLAPILLTFVFVEEPFARIGELLASKF